MKIVSKHHDYYDSCLAYGSDERVVYLRNMTEYNVQFDRDIKQHPPIIRELYNVFLQVRSGDANYHEDTYRWLHRGHNVVDGFKTKEYEFHFNTFSVLFCGKHYPGIRCQRFVTVGATSVPNKVDWFYSADDLLTFLQENGQDLTKKTGRWDKKTMKDRIVKYFTTTHPNVDWMIENKVTCVVYEKFNHKILINPLLKDYGFYKVFDPYTAFQELDVWLCGTLSWPFNMMIEISDKSKVAKHGFDMKYGFRTRPQEKNDGR